MSYRVGTFVYYEMKKGEIINLARKENKLFALVKFSTNEEKWILAQDLSLV